MEKYPAPPAELDLPLCEYYELYTVSVEGLIWFSQELLHQPKGTGEYLIFSALIIHIYII